MVIIRRAGDSGGLFALDAIEDRRGLKLFLFDGI
jgi:hypothetical protein